VPAKAPPRSSASLQLKPLPRSFFARTPETVARELLGKMLVRRERGKLLGGRIVETEAYLGAEDAAAHAYRGQTPRNAVLFGPPGHAYVYFTYGMHFCMNVSCQPPGQAGCVLLRALEPVEGIASMARNRGLDVSNMDFSGPQIAEEAFTRKLRGIASGPARLCEALAITRERDNGKDLCGEKADLRILDCGVRYSPRQVAVTPRIGISRAMELPLRFTVKQSAFLSR